MFLTSLWTFATRGPAFEIWIALVVLVVSSFFLQDVWRRRKLPPGPYGLPILGYLPFLTDPLWDLHKLGQKYGDIFSFKKGSQTVVVLHGVETITEGLARPELLGRPPIGPLKLFNENSAFFMNADLHKWREQRRFVLHSMKDLGLGKTVIEEDIMDEINHFLDKIRVHSGSPMDLREPLTSSISNNICTLVFGKRYEYENPERVFLDKNLEAGTEGFDQTSIAGFFPWLLKIPLVSRFSKLNKTFTVFKNLKTFFKTVITKHRDTFDPKNIRDFIDSYIHEQNSRLLKDPNTTFCDDTLVSNVLDLFTAGSETVKTSILWCVYIAAAFPQHQEKVKDEILEVMGQDRDPEFQDLKSMPFTHSFILEVMRWKTIVPMNISHCTLSETTICGYHIPKNVSVLFNLWNAHHNPNYWDDPESFIPDRFITKDGKSVSKPSHFMPFSKGKRICPGEPMAMVEIFLYFTSILQKFQVVFPDEYKPTFRAVTKVNYRLDPYKVRFLSRS